MAIEILPLGGLGEIGKNMTAIGFDGKYVIIDMGFRLDSILGFEDVDIGGMGQEELVQINGIPDDTPLHNRDVEAIVLTHGHLDHIGAIGKLAHAYDAPIYGTPFTIELARHVIREERTFKVPNELKVVMPGDVVEVNGMELEFIGATHSILQTVFVAAHGANGSVLCASDFKLDDEPLLGNTTDYNRLRRLTNDGLLAALVGAVRVDEPGPTGSEARAREMLREIMAETTSTNGAVLVTTFSSHIVRIKSIVDLSFELGRTPVVLGRSLCNYCTIAAELGLVEFPPELHIHGRPNAVHNLLRRIEESRGDYVLLVTGHQGEPTSLLTRIADEQLPFRIRNGDEIIFSASVIPNPINESNRELLEAKLRAQGAHIYKNVHVSGHAGRCDTSEFIKLIKPEQLVPCHSTFDKLKIVADIGRELGYSDNQLHILKNGMGLRLGD
jgi:ribonuclease J